MTEQNGVWSAKILSEITVFVNNNKIESSSFNRVQNAYPSHLEQKYSSKDLIITLFLYYNSAHSAITLIETKNTSDQPQNIQITINGQPFLESLSLESKEKMVQINSTKSDAVGYIQILDKEASKPTLAEKSYSIKSNVFELAPNTSTQTTLAHSFIFSNYNTKTELNYLENTNAREVLQNRILEKEQQIAQLNSKRTIWKDSTYDVLLSKTLQTLQNNSRVAAGELKHAGIFP